MTIYKLTHRFQYFLAALLRPKDPGQGWTRGDGGQIGKG